MTKSAGSGDRTVAGCGMHIESNIAIEQNGSIHFVTHTYTHCKLKGFTGGTKAIFSDVNGNVLYQTPIESYGVDGEGIPFKHSNRWDEKYYNVNPSIYNNTDRIDVLVFPNGRNRLLEDIGTTFDLIGKAVKWAIENYGSGQTNQSSGNPTDSSTESGDYSVDMGDENYLVGSYQQKLTSIPLATPGSIRIRKK